MGKVKLDLRNMENRTKVMKKEMNSMVFQVGLRAKLLIIDNHLKGKGADDKKFNKLTPDYKEMKVQSGRSGQRTLNFTGKLHIGLEVVRKSVGRYILKFRNDQLKKARGNARYAPNMIVPVSDRIDRKLQQLYFKLWDNKTT